MLNQPLDWLSIAAATRGWRRAARSSRRLRPICAIFAPAAPLFDSGDSGIEKRLDSRPDRRAAPVKSIVKSRGKSALTAPLAIAFAGALASAAAVPGPAAAAGLSGKSGIFKVVKPPPKGARKRITIHAGRTGSVRAATPARRTERHSWFWNEVSPSLASGDPGRLAPLAARAGERLGVAGKDARLIAIASRYGGDIAAASIAARVSPRLLFALVAAESGGDPKAVSTAGAQGLGQLIPATARRFGVADPFDPAENLKGSAAYLAFLLGMFEKDALLALAAYNAGENAVLKHGGVPPFAETRDYVPIVLSWLHAVGGFCAKTPPLPVCRG